jgi:hypothetical protein
MWRLHSRSPGPDGIVPVMLRLLLLALSGPLADLFNASLRLGRVPVTWKRVRIVPLPKVPQPSEGSHYRPITVGNCIGKLLDLLVLDQLSRHVLDAGRLCGSQSAFHPRHSTQLALVGVLDPVREAIDRRRLSLVVSLDLARAYDSVRHDLLLALLRSLGLDGGAVAWFADYLAGRRGCLRTPEGGGCPSGGSSGPGSRRGPVSPLSSSTYF